MICGHFVVVDGGRNIMGRLQGRTRSYSELGGAVLPSQEDGRTTLQSAARIARVLPYVSLQSCECVTQP